MVRKCSISIILIFIFTLNTLFVHGTDARINQFQEPIESIVYKYMTSGEIGVYVRDLVTGEEYMHNGFKTVTTGENVEGYFRSASVAKLCMAYVVAKKIELEEISITDKFKDPVSGREQTFKKALTRMLSYSDNSMYNTCLRYFTREETQRMLDEFGLEHLVVYGEMDNTPGYTSARNKKLHGTTRIGMQLTPYHLGKILNYVYAYKEKYEVWKHVNTSLIGNVYNSRIPKGLGFKYPIAHKTGTATNYGVFNDAGIVYTENPYILVVLTKGTSKSVGEGTIRKIAVAVNDIMTK